MHLVKTVAFTVTRSIIRLRDEADGREGTSDRGIREDARVLVFDGCDAVWVALTVAIVVVHQVVPSTYLLSHTQIVKRILADLREAVTDPLRVDVHLANVSIVILDAALRHQCIGP